MNPRKHTNADFRRAIATLESQGWSINTDGTITRTQVPVKNLVCDPRLKNTEPRYLVVLDRGRTTIKRGTSWPPSSASWRPRSGLTRLWSTYGSTLSRKRAPGLLGAARAATAADSWRASVTLTTQTSGNAFNVAARTHLHGYSRPEELKVLRRHVHSA